MATGPDHYREAERLLDAANRRLIGNDAEWLNTPARRAELRTEAQVRATLAVAAATALNDAEDGLVAPDWSAWREAAGVKTEVAPL